MEQQEVGQVSLLLNSSFINQNTMQQFNQSSPLIQPTTKSSRKNTFSEQRDKSQKRKTVLPPVVIFPSPQDRFKAKLTQNDIMAEKIHIFSRDQPLVRQLEYKSSLNIQSRVLYTFYVDKGNNFQLVKKVLSMRNWLMEHTSPSVANIRWKPVSKDFNFAQLGANGKRLSINHLEFHSEISNKMKLFENLSNYCKKVKLNINDFVPVTFIINLDSNTLQTDLKSFMDYFIKLQNEQNTKNVWLLKPPDLNRGQGIQLFNNLHNFIEQVEELTNYRDNETRKLRHIDIQPVKQGRSVTVTFPSLNGEDQQLRASDRFEKMNFMIHQSYSLKDRIIVLQKYIENPLLYNGRKFDIRVWVLVDHQLNYYFFREGYIRLACESYYLSQHSIRNLYIHLTNNAIQKNHQNYGKIELGNQLSFADLQKNYFTLRGFKGQIRETIVTRIKELIVTTINSANDKLAQSRLGDSLIFEQATDNSNSKFSDMISWWIIQSIYG